MIFFNQKFEQGKKLLKIKLFRNVIFVMTIMTFYRIDISLAFTLISSSPPRFSTNEIILDFTSDTCANTGWEVGDLYTALERAGKSYWNKVTTSRLKFKKGKYVSVSSDGLTVAELARLGEANHIIVGCNNDESGFSSGGVGAVATMVSDANGVRGAILINDHVNTGIINITEDELTTLLAHEMGHAFGLGHSAFETALMYYSIEAGEKVQDFLSQDDNDGLTYLYPQEKLWGGVGGGCSSVTLLDQLKNSTSSSSSSSSTLGQSENSQESDFFKVFSLGFLLVIFLHLFMNRFRNIRVLRN